MWVNPFPQVRCIPSAGGGPVGAGMPAKQATRWMAPATPVFAGEPAPTGYGTFRRLVGSLWERACPRSRRRDGWHRLRRCSRARPLPQVWRIPSAGGGSVGAGMPAKQATRWMAPAAPVFAGEPAPTGYGTFRRLVGFLWERACPRSRRRGGWHRLRRCSRVNPLPQGMARSVGWWGSCGSGHAREAGDAVDGTGYAGVRG